jgi:hypothetical protein
MKLKKLDMALEQFEDALKSYFDGRYHSATVLAGAAEQLFAGYLLKHKQEPSWTQMRSAATKIANGLKQQSGDEEPTTLDEMGKVMNRAYNNSKHAGTKDHAVWLDAKMEAQQVIDRTIANFDQLSARPEYDLPVVPLAQRFIMESIESIRGGGP